MDFHIAYAIHVYYMQQQQSAQTVAKHRKKKQKGNEKSTHKHPITVVAYNLYAHFIYILYTYTIFQ